MKLILKDNVVGLGFKDDVVEVKDGYGRNYLIPRGLGIVATKSALKQHEEILRQRANKLEALKARAEELAKAIESIPPVVIPTKISETGTIFGSVNNVHIAEVLEKHGHQVERKMIEIKTPVKEAGKYVAYVHLHRDVTAQVPFEVISEDALFEVPAEAPKAEENTEVSTPEAE